jgi:hypothetical protein
MAIGRLQSSGYSLEWDIAGFSRKNVAERRRVEVVQVGTDNFQSDCAKNLCRVESRVAVAVAQTAG